MSNICQKHASQDWGQMILWHQGDAHGHWLWWALFRDQVMVHCYREELDHISTRPTEALSYRYLANMNHIKQQIVRFRGRHGHQCKNKVQSPTRNKTPISNNDFILHIVKRVTSCQQQHRDWESTSRLASQTSLCDGFIVRSVHFFANVSTE